MLNIAEATQALIAQGLSKGASDVLMKAINQATGLVAYDLEAPSKKLYPVLSPIRNSLARVSDGKGGTAVNWKAVIGGGANGEGDGPAPGTYQIPVQEGKRNATFDLTTANYVGVYKGFGVEQSVTFEADFAGLSFEDVKALAALVNLQVLMIGEEKLIVGGNSSIALGTPTAPTLTDVGTGGAIDNGGTVYVSVVALSHEALQGATVAGGVPTVSTRNNAGGDTTVINGGSSQISTAANVACNAGGNAQSVTATVPLIQGAVAYAWYWGLSSGAAQKLGAITTLNSYVITTNAGLGTQAANAAGLAADHSQDDLAFDGLISIAAGAGMMTGASSSGAYIASMATGAAGVGTSLTSDGAAGVVEIDAMLLDRWNRFRLGFDTLYVNAQEASTITRLVTGNNGSPLIRFMGDLRGNKEQMLGIAGGTFVKSYFNKFTGQTMDVVVHPYVPAGMIIATASSLPYPVSQVGNVWQMRLRKDYYAIDWPLTNRSYPKGVYFDGFLQHYFPPAIGIIYNIGALPLAS